MSLSQKDQFLLDCFMYTTIPVNNSGSSLEDTINMYTDPKTGKVTEEMLKKYNVKPSGSISRKQMAQVMNDMKESPSLMNLRIAQTTREKEGEIRAACFVDETTGKATVAFRGTGGSFKQWYLNFEAYGEVSTSSQRDAVDFINSLPYEHIDVTGHSNGGGYAMYVTIVCGDKIDNCLAFEGQGVSREFTEKYKQEIKEGRDKIVNISACDDVVNPLLISIAGERLFVKSNGKGFPHGLMRIYEANQDSFDENGNFKKSAFVKQSEFAKGVNDVTVKLSEWSDVPVIGAMVEYVADIGGATIGLFMGGIGEVGERLDDFAKTLVESAVKYIVNIHAEAVEVVYKFGEYVGEWVKKGVEALAKKFDKGYKYANENPRLKADTNRMREYASKLRRLNKRVMELDRRMDRLYKEVKLSDLWDLMKADLLTSYSLRLTAAAGYLEATASEFEKVEKDLCKKLG